MDRAVCGAPAEKRVHAVRGEWADGTAAEVSQRARFRPYDSETRKVWMPPLRRREEADREDAEQLEADQERLRALKIELDRCWDLLRQRRAHEEFGQDPEEAQVRDADTVERYLQ